jgi:DNA-binding transcriptional ArsR family regulator
MAGSVNYRVIERIVKGVANHRRLEILDVLKSDPELSVYEISERLNIGYENASDHVRKLAIAGLVMKRNDGPSVRHKITHRGESMLMFCKKLQ